MRRRLNSAQALLELAVMSTAVFVCIGVLISYGMNANYNDHVRMTGFRKAVSLAQERGLAKNINPTAALTVMQDRFVPTPASGPGAAQPMAASASNSLSWTNKLNTVPTPEAMSNPGSVPRIDVEVNGARQTYSVAAWEDRGPYPWGYSFFIQEDVEGAFGVWWRWKMVTAGEKDGDGRYYVEAGQAVDVDADGTLEQIIAMSRDCPSAGNCRINRIVYIDPNEGQVDLGYDDAGRPWVHGGLSPEYDIHQESTGTFNRQHAGSSIHTDTSITNKGNVVRKLIAREGEEISIQSVPPEVHVDFSYDGSF